MLKRILIILLIIPLLSFVKIPSEDPKAIMENMVSTCFKINSLTYSQRKMERANGKYTKGFSKIKYKKHPFSVYMKQITPKEGLEVLFIDGENNNNALINTNGFPWVNVNLNPLGDKMRDGQHHTIFESGFYYFAGIVKHLTEKYKNYKGELLIYQGKVKFNNRLCHKVVVENENFEYINHKVKAGQTLLSIAKRHFICEHIMLELNPDLDDYHDIKEGDVIIRPNDYAKSFTFLVDVERNIPLKITVYDDKGMYEHYEFIDLTINPTFKEGEFTEEFEEYGF